jgi:hypothetical protein
MLQNAYFLAKIGADTAENEQHFAEILPIGRRVADRCLETSQLNLHGGAALRRRASAVSPPGGGMAEQRARARSRRLRGYK